MTRYIVRRIVLCLLPKYVLARHSIKLSIRVDVIQAGVNVSSCQNLTMQRMLTHDEIFKRTISLFTGETQGLKVAGSRGIIVLTSRPLTKCQLPRRITPAVAPNSPELILRIQVNNVRGSKLWTSTLGSQSRFLGHINSCLSGSCGFKFQGWPGIEEGA